MPRHWQDEDRLRHRAARKIQRGTGRIREGPESSTHSAKSASYHSGPSLLWKPRVQCLISRFRVLHLFLLIPHHRYYTIKPPHSAIWTRWPSATQLASLIAPATELGESPPPKENPLARTFGCTQDPCFGFRGHLPLTGLRKLGAQLVADYKARSSLSQSTEFPHPEAR
jgi:hypothetical protein